MSTNGDNSLRIWSLTREDEKYHVSHTDEITCFVITADSLHVITGSRDHSLKVWQSTGGKLAQVREREKQITLQCTQFSHSVIQPTGARRSFRCCTHRGCVCHEQESSLIGIKGLQSNLVGFAHGRGNPYVSWSSWPRHMCPCLG